MTVLTIAGFDSSGNAGIDADLETFTKFSVPAHAIPTADTLQTERGVERIYPRPLRQVSGFLDKFLPPTIAVKTGMLTNAPIVELVAHRLTLVDMPIVVDPVILATSGGRLLEEDAIDPLIKLLIPLAALVTPNAPEAERLSGRNVRSRSDALSALRVIHDLGPAAVLIKGGHLPGDDVVDYLFDGKEVIEFASRRLDKELRGSGCRLSAGIAAGLARGDNLQSAIAESRRRLITNA